MASTTRSGKRYVRSDTVTTALPLLKRTRTVLPPPPLPYLPVQYTLPPPYNDHALGIREMIDPLHLCPPSMVAIIADYACVLWKVQDTVMVLCNPASRIYEVITIYGNELLYVISSRSPFRFKYIHGESAQLLVGAALTGQIDLYDRKSLMHQKTYTGISRSYIDYTLASRFASHQPSQEEQAQRYRVHEIKTKVTHILLPCLHALFQPKDRLILEIITDYYVMPYVPDVSVAAAATITTAATRKGRKKHKKKGKGKANTASPFEHLPSVNEHLQEPIQRMYHYDPSRFSEYQQTMHGLKRDHL